MTGAWRRILPVLPLLGVYVLVSLADISVLDPLSDESRYLTYAHNLTHGLVTGLIRYFVATDRNGAIWGVVAVIAVAVSPMQNVVGSLCLQIATF